MHEFEEYLQKAHEKLKATEILLSNGFYEDAISRAYYAMFYAARALLSTKNIYPKTHRGIVQKFGLEFVSKGLIEGFYAKALIAVQERRERADYDIYYIPTFEEAKEIFETAQRFVKRVEQAISEMVKNNERQNKT
ncbi:HEPN domain-containing protein [Thermococcus barophilus]|uniref:HEPN domain-containing protein n=1 Tax=Thermococcus barophilus (strain DSM 11836 / MP) TaxID=391623 RepID=F0LHR5_THEBM|nr:HEPN domain-containing protein [Thermococcus barophilus]ADT83149.1 hypothetical protein TERMP_00172 [Thermococcus barophilus MP]